jgi:hypothetical protein
MQESTKKAMEHVKEEHYSTFCKHLLVYDLGLGTEFLQEIEAHYDNISNT